MYNGHMYVVLMMRERPLMHSKAFGYPFPCVVMAVLRRLSVWFENCIPDAIWKQGNRREFDGIS